MASKLGQMTVWVSRINDSTTILGVKICNKHLQRSRHTDVIDMDLYMYPVVIYIFTIYKKTMPGKVRTKKLPEAWGVTAKGILKAGICLPTKIGVHFPALYYGENPSIYSM